MLLNEIFGSKRRAAHNKLKKRQHILRLINRVRGEASSEHEGSSREITDEIFTSGDCGRLFFIISHVYSDATAVWDSKLRHVLTDIDGELYDIHGSKGLRKDYANQLRPITDKEIRDEMMHKRYSFKNRGPGW